MLQEKYSMPEKSACIYCGIEADLSESDIIPDALTNARITKKFNGAGHLL